MTALDRLRPQHKNGPRLTTGGLTNTTEEESMMATDIVPTHNRQPRTPGDDIRDTHAGDHAAWLAALMGLPVEHVRAKLAQAECHGTLAPQTYCADCGAYNPEVR